MNPKAFEEILWSLKFRKRKSPEVSRNEFLKQIPFFEHLSPKQLNVISQHLHERRYEENEYLFEINHPGAALFIVMRGEVAIETSSDRSSAVEIATIKAGEFLGELALLDESPRSASARAKRPTSAFALFREDLNRMGKTEPEIAFEIYKTLAWIIGERLKATNRKAHIRALKSA
jgi:CRP/FNR family transcriptional regulator, cyclic AMP receptor protein